VSTSGKTSSSRRREPRKRTGRSRQLLRWGLVFFAEAMIVDAIVGDRGLLAMLRAREHFEVASATLDQQRADNARLREEVKRLKDDPAAIEELARGELGLMRPGEKLFIVKDLEPPSDR